MPDEHQGTFNIREGPDLPPEDGGCRLSTASNKLSFDAYQGADSKE